MSQTKRGPETEQFIETETDSVELEYDNGNLCRVLVTATWRKGTRVLDGELGGEQIDSEISAHVEYTVIGSEAELTGFYPNTNRTGRDRYRETLEAVRVLDHARKVVRERVGDSINVQFADTGLVERLSD